MGEADEGRTVKEVLKQTLGVSGRMVQRLTRSDGLRLNGKPTFLSRSVRAGDVLSARINPPEDSDLPAVRMDLSIVHESQDVLVLDKPAFLLVHPNRPSHTRTLAHGVAYHLERHGIRNRVRPVHRLDRDTSGLVLFAKTPHAHHQLDGQLRKRRLARGYLAVVHGVPAEDEASVEAPVGPHATRRNLRAVTETGGQPARTRYEVVERFPDAALLRLELETGRTHQIRVHMSHLGHPLIGDVDYGGAALDGFARQALHAFSLAFDEPATGERIEVESPLPPDMERLLETLRG